MAWHSDIHKRKLTGGKSHVNRGRRKFERGGFPSETKRGEEYRVPKRTRGGKIRVKLLSTSTAHVSNRKTGVTKIAKILRVLKNPSNVDYNRRGIITRGALLETDVGIARVSSRPGQDGVVNALLEEKK